MLPSKTNFINRKYKNKKTRKTIFKTTKLRVKMKKFFINTTSKGIAKFDTYQNIKFVKLPMKVHALKPIKERTFPNRSL